VRAGWCAPIRKALHLAQQEQSLLQEELDAAILAKVL
jgi:hypothetical protein